MVWVQAQKDAGGSLHIYLPLVKPVLQRLFGGGSRRHVGHKLLKQKRC